MKIYSPSIYSFILLFIVIIFSFYNTSYSQYRNIENMNTIVESVNREKISILTFRYIDSCDIVNSDRFSLMHIFYENGYNSKSKKYELEISVPFKIVKLLLSNLGYLVGQNYSILFGLPLIEDDNTLMNDYINNELNLLNTSKFGIPLPVSFRIISVKIPFYLIF